MPALQNKYKYLIIQYLHRFLNVRRRGHSQQLAANVKIDAAIEPTPYVIHRV